MALNTEIGVTAAKIYYGEVGNNLLPFALSLSPVFCKVKSIFPDIFGENLTQQNNFPACNRVLWLQGNKTKQISQPKAIDLHGAL